VIPFMKLPVLALLLVLLAPALLAGQTLAAEAAGAQLFRDKGCVYCHGAGGAGTQKAPALTGLPTDKHWSPARIRAQILNGGQKMPPFADSVTDEEVEQLVAYLRAQNKPAPPAK
jgi:mono/diheme cytochrome c family protein